MKQFYKKLSIFFVFGMLLTASCSKEDLSEDPDVKTTEEISRYQVVTVNIAETDLNENEYQGTLAGEQILLSKSSPNTLVFSVSPYAVLGKTDLVINSLGHIVHYDIKDTNLTDSPENTLAPFLRNIDSYSAQAEFLELEESKTSLSIIKAFNSFYKDANAEQKDAVAKLYKANKASFDFILISGINAKTKKFTPTEFASTAADLFGAAVTGVIIGIGIIQIADYVAAKPPLFAVIKFVGAVLGTVALVTAAQNLLKFTAAKCKAVWLYISSLIGTNNKNTNESFLSFQNDVNLITSMNTHRRSVDMSDSKSSNNLLARFFKAYSTYTVSINSINTVINYVNNYNPLYKIPNLSVRKIPENTQAQEEVMTQEIFKALTFSVSNSNLTIVSATLGTDGQLNMKIKAKSTSTIFPVESFVNYSYTDEFSSFSGKFPIKVVLASPLVGNWKLESFDGGILPGQYGNLYHDKCTSIIYEKYSILSQTMVFTESTFTESSSWEYILLNKVIDVSTCTVTKDSPDTQWVDNTSSSGTYKLNNGVLEVNGEDGIIKTSVSFISDNKIKIDDDIYVRQ